jgi:hypothetical protein
MDGRQTVPVAGTRVTLSPTPVAVAEVTITAEADNTGAVVVGGDTCVAALATRQGTPLNAGDAYALAIDDLQKVYLDAVVASDGVTWTAVL